jgi:LysR family hydrogen peroxide-inducible transcriptional activator
MTLTELRYIVTLSEQRHFGRAAVKCFVSQPTLSVAVKKLEDELGIAIFERSKGSIVVTELGQKLVNQAKSILDQVNVFKDLAQEGKDELSTPLRLGAIYTIGPYLFPHLMPQLNQSAPDMPLYIEENYTTVLCQKLKACELDAIIVALPFDEPDVVTMPLYDEQFVVLLPKQHPLAVHESLTSHMLLDDNLLMLGPGHCFRDQVLSACSELLNLVGLPAADKAGSKKLITEGSSLETIRHMVASGLGISVLPKSALMKGYYDEALLDVRPFSAPTPYRSVALAWRATFPRPKAIDVLAQATKRSQEALIDPLLEG